MSHFADIVVVDLSDVASKEALLTTLGAALDLGGPNGNVPVAHSKAGRGWGMNWDALEDSLRELHNGGIWGTARRIAFIENEAKKAERIAKMLAAGKQPKEKSSPSHSNYITYLGPHTKQFYQVFSAFGQVINV